MIYKYLGDIAEIKGGKRMPKGTRLQQEKNQHPYLRITDYDGKSFDRNSIRYVPDEVFEKISNYTVTEGDIFLSIVGTIGIATTIDKEYDNANLTENAVKIIPDESVNSKYILYFLQSMLGQRQMNELSVGSTQKKLPIKNIKKIKILLPNLEIQNKVVSNLQILDKKIALNNQINDNLMKLNTLLFQQLSVDSDYTLSNFTDCQNGFAFKSSEYITNNELLILRTLNMTSDHLFSKNGVKYISKVYKEKYQKFEFKKFDTTLVMVGASIGKMALITTNVIPSLQNQNMWRFRSKSKMPGLLIYDMVQYVNDRVRSSATGSARSFYRKKMFLNSKVPVISEKYYDIFLAIQEKINNIANENETLSNLKNVLLSKYF